MAVSNDWFTNWQPPDFSFAFSDPFKNSTTFGNDGIQNKERNAQMHSFLPVFMSLGIIRSTEKPPLQTDSQVPKSIRNNANPNTKKAPNRIIGNHQAQNDAKKEPPFKPIEITGPFKTWYRWKTLDLSYPSDMDRLEAITRGDFVPENNLPLGIETYEDRIFLSMPKWKTGVPVTLAYISITSHEESPKLNPFPNWDWHSETTCDHITSVFRMQADHCGRLWILDSGNVKVTENITQHCPPKLLIFDLKTDTLMKKFVFPESFIKQGGLFSNIVLDMRDKKDCDNIFAYMMDVWRYGLVVYSLRQSDAWYITHHYFYPDPFAALYKLHHLEFVWADGLFGGSLGPYSKYTDERILYFHPMSSTRQFFVNTSVVLDEFGWEKRKKEFNVFGQSRGPKGQVSGAVMNDDGIMFFNQVTRDTVGCWDSKKPYKRDNLGIVARSRQTMVFPNDIRLDQAKRQSIWIVSNRLPYYLLEGLDTSRINFRVMSAFTDEAIKGTICDPEVSRNDTFIEFEDFVNDCYG